MSWFDGGETDIDYWVVKKQYDSGPLSYITRTVNNYTDTYVLVKFGGGIVAKYWVKAVDLAELSSPYSNMRSTEVLPIAKAIADGELMPEIYKLHAAHPNPFNPSTTIQYDLPETSEVAMVIYDLMGREVMRWQQAQERPGYKAVVWNGTDQSGRAVPTGIYIYQLVAASTESDQRFTATRKLLLLK